MGDLAGVVHEIAGDQRLLALRGDAHADMAGGVAERRHEADFVADAVIGLDQIDEAGLPYRRYGIGEAPPSYRRARAGWSSARYSTRPIR